MNHDPDKHELEAGGKAIEGSEGGLKDVKLGTDFEQILFLLLGNNLRVGGENMKVIGVVDHAGYIEIRVEK